MMGMEHELMEQLKRIQALEELELIEERESSVMGAVNLAKHMGMKAGYRSVDDDSYPKPEWAGNIVAYIVLPTGQVAYFLQKTEVEYDGHDRPTKIERIRKFIKGEYTRPMIEEVGTYE